MLRPCNCSPEAIPLSPPHRCVLEGFGPLVVVRHAPETQAKEQNTKLSRGKVLGRSEERQKLSLFLINLSRFQPYNLSQVSFALNCLTGFVQRAFPSGSQ